MESLLGWLKKDYIDKVNIKTTEFPLNRIKGFINLKYGLPIHQTGYTYMPFTISSSIIYSILYWKKGEPIYACVSPTFESSKGEFRDSFCNYKQVDEVFNKYPKVLCVIEDILLEKFKAKEFDMDYGIYTGEEYDYGEKSYSNIGIKLLAISGFMTLYRLTYNQIQLHTHKTYINMLNKLLEGIDKNFIFKHYKESKDIYNIIFRNDSERPYGQKLTPLTVGEVISVGDISYKPWRELIISYAVSDMVLNYISPNFAIGSNWTYLEGVDSTMFDNMIIRHKLTINKTIEKMVDDYKRIYEESSKIEDIEVYRENLLAEINDLNKNKLLSKVALARIDENVGFTMGTIPRNIRKAEIVQPHYNNFINDIDYFNKYIFDILYGCHVLHKKLGIINFDLHLNNVTIMKAYNFYKTKVTETGIQSITYAKGEGEKYCTAYTIGSNTYYFPFDGFYGSIIDFSDSIINSTFLDYTYRYGSGERQNEDEIIDKEKDEIYTKLADSLSYVEKNKDSVKGAIISNYDNMFKVIATIDYVTFLRKLRMTFERESEVVGDKRPFKVSEPIRKKLKSMEDRSLAYMLKIIQQVTTGTGAGRDAVQFPGDALIPEFFGSYTKKEENVAVFEAWNFNLNIEHSVGIYRNFPSWAKKDYIEDKYGDEVAKEFFKDRDLVNTKDSHIDFIMESVKIEADPKLNRFTPLTRTRNSRRKMFPVR